MCNQNDIPIQSQQDIGNAKNRIKVPKSNYLLVPLFNYLTSSILDTPFNDKYKWQTQITRAHILLS